jgi:hypothetical protein
MALLHSPRIVTDGLVLCLDAGNTKSYVGSGTTWRDLSGRGNTGTLTNGPTYSSDNGGSIVFDGTNDYVNLGNILNIGTGQFSIECIARVSSLTSVNYSKVASKGDYLDGGWRLYMGKNPSNNYSLNFQYGNNTIGDISISIGAIQENTWYHIVVCRNSNNLLSTYLNGSVGSGSTTTTFNLTTNSYNYFIGKDGRSLENFKGNVTCYRHYNRALTAAEIQQNFNALRVRFGI